MRTAPFALAAGAILSTALVVSAAPAHAQSRCLFLACDQPVATATVTCCTSGPDVTGVVRRHEVAPAAAPRTAKPPKKARKAHAAKAHVRKARAAHARPAIRHAVARPAPTRARHAVRPVRHAPVHAPDPIRDHAATYGARATGASEAIAAFAGRGERWVTSSWQVTGWAAPAAVSWHQGQSCGWGARVLTAPDGATRQERAWLCQCAEGWRPPGL
jgi:hypothetical protein